jgi:type I restriction enzyme S subunit
MGHGTANLTTLAEGVTSAHRRRFKPYPVYKDSGVEWLGEIPAHWEMKRLKFVAPIRINKLETKPDDSVYVGLEHVESWTGRLLLDTQPETVDSVVASFSAGDVLFGKLRPYLAKAARPDFDGVCTSEILPLRPSAEVSQNYLMYFLINAPFIRWLDSLTYGSKMPRVSPEQIATSFTTVPPLPEQRAIGEFLDRRTARIDALVAKNERLIELLQEERTALIARAVTEALNPQAPMKDSGLEWPGKIPAHWEVKPFTKYVVEKSDYRGKTPEKVPSGVFLVTARNVRMGLIDYDCSQEFVAQDEYDEIMRRGLPKEGDILFTTEAPLGNVALVDREDVALAQRIIRFRMNAEHFDSRFTLYSMMSSYFQSQLLSLSTGSTAAGLKASKLPMLRLVAPPLTEQRAISAFLDLETVRIDGLMAKVRDAIHRLNELRVALISAAVTGRIDVRGEEAK